MPVMRNPESTKNNCTPVQPKLTPSSTKCTQSPPPSNGFRLCARTSRIAIPRTPSSAGIVLAVPGQLPTALKRLAEELQEIAPDRAADRAADRTARSRQHRDVGGNCHCEKCVGYVMRLACQACLVVIGARQWGIVHRPIHARLLSYNN